MSNCLAINKLIGNLAHVHRFTKLPITLNGYHSYSKWLLLAVYEYNHLFMSVLLSE